MWREPNPSDEFIWWLFRNRCVVCGYAATEINEIVPRSRGKDKVLDWKNRVCMCHNCHNEYHKHGVNDGAILLLQQTRVEFLIGIGRDAYV